MYDSFQLAPPRASSHQACEGLIPLLFLVSFYVTAIVCVCTTINPTYWTIFTCFWEMIASWASKTELVFLCNFPSTICVFLFESVTLPYPVIVLTDSALCFSYLFCNFDMTQVTWYCQHSSDKDKLTFQKPWIVSTIAIWNSASSIMNAQIVSTFSFFLSSWTQHLYLVNIFCHFLLQVVVQSSIAKFFCSFGFF